MKVKNFKIKPTTIMTIMTSSDLLPPFSRFSFRANFGTTSTKKSNSNRPAISTTLTLCHLWPTVKHFFQQLLTIYCIILWSSHLRNQCLIKTLLFILPISTMDLSPIWAGFTCKNLPPSITFAAILEQHHQKQHRWKSISSSWRFWFKQW